MPRPTRPCAKCAKALQPCDHLGLMYDAELAKHGGPIPAYEQAELEYALNRKWALTRDNGNKRVGVLPTRRYQSNLDRADEARAKAKERALK